MVTPRINNLSAHLRNEVRTAVSLAMRLWPNAHLGEVTELEDMHSAFRMIRNGVASGLPIQAAIGDVYDSACRHSNM